MIPNVGPMEILVVLVVALVVFGPKRLPELGHSLGRGIRDFKDGISGKEAEEGSERQALTASGAEAVAAPAAATAEKEG